MSEINNTLNERGERYGKFKGVAATTYALQEILRDAKSYKHMSDDQAISDCSLSNLCQNDTQNSLLIKQENQDMGDDSHIENHISKNCKVIEHEAE